VAEVTWSEGDVRFKVTCGFSHSLSDDPIVFPAVPGASHLHDFTGNMGTNANTTTWADLQAFPTTCNDPGDVAAYWTPALEVNGVKRDPVRATVYYRRGFKTATIQPWGAGLKMVAGYSASDPSAPRGRTGWQCDNLNDPIADPSGCSTNITMVVEFPDCWDGVNLDSPNHRSHMTYSQPIDNGAHICPNTHLVPVPQATMYVHFGDLAPGEAVTGLSSGDVSTVHGDLLDGWDPARLEQLVDECLNAFVLCDSGGP
jgi:hypothetical protein